MLTLIITKGNISKEFDFNSTFDKENLQGISELSFQDETKTLHIQVNEDSFNIFSKISDVIISSNIQDITNLNSILTQTNSEEELELTQLQELQALLKGKNFSFESFDLEGTQADANSTQNSFFIANEEIEKIVEKPVQERVIDDLTEDEQLVSNRNSLNNNSNGPQINTTSNLGSDITAPDIPIISNITDTYGDFSNIIMTGEGDEVGNIITLYDEDYNLVATTSVSSLLTWSIDITSLSNTAINDNEFFRATQSDSSGNTSLYSEATHFNHYNWANAQTDNFDDYALSGSGDDRLYVNDDDLNDRVVADGGDGVDKLVFSGNKEDYTITHNLDGSVTILEDGSSDSNADGIGDETIARNIEELVFDNGSIFTNTLSSPIAFDLNNDGIISVTGETSSINKNLNASIGETVKFDINFDGVKDTIEWFDGSGDGILIDNKDGLAMSDMDGSRLFGDQNGTYSNGYEKLATLDINNDGELSNKELDGLNIWIDDGDAKVEEGELKTLEELGIKSISTQMSEVMDEEGRVHMQSTIQKDDDSIILSEDVWFKEKDSDTIDLEDINIQNSSVNFDNLNSDTLNIRFEDFISIKDENNEVFILGNQDDNILLEGGVKSEENKDGLWEKLSTKEDAEGNAFNIYQSSNGESIIKLVIENDIDINNI